MPCKHEICDRSATPCIAAAMLGVTLLLGPSFAEATATRTPTSGGGTVVLEPVPASEPRRTWRRLVFTCTSPGLVVFSDRPCGPLPVVLEVKGRAPRETTGTAGISSTVVPPTPAASTRPATVDVRPDHGGDDAEQRATACRRLQDAVRALDDRMRAGYSAREAAMLWNRWREAKQRVREADC